MIKKILILLIAICCIALLPACKKGSEDEGSAVQDNTEASGSASETESRFEPLLLVGDGAPSYFVVISKNADKELQTLADGFKDSLKRCGMSVKNCSDLKEPSDYEIVINDTNRDFDYDIKKDVGEYGYYIVSEGRRIYIGANGSYGIRSAMAAFLKELFGYSDGMENYAPKDRVVIESALEIIYAQKTLLEDLRFAENSIYDYTLRAEKSLGTADQKISTMVKKVLGVDIPVKDEGKHLSISIEKTDAKSSSFEILADGNAVIKAATDREAIRAFALFFNQNIRGVEDTSLNIPAGKYVDEDVAGFVLYSEFGATGDGINDDVSTIVLAHNYANSNGLKVRADENAVYYMV